MLGVIVFMSFVVWELNAKVEGKTACSEVFNVPKSPVPLTLPFHSFRFLTQDTATNMKLL